MSDIIETTSGDARDEYKIVTSPNFIALAYELESLILNGWQITSADSNFLLYEVKLEKNAATIARAKEKLEAGEAGRPVWGTEQRKDNMAKARETRMAKIAAKRAAEGGGDEG